MTVERILDAERRYSESQESQEITVCFHFLPYVVFTLKILLLSRTSFLTKKICSRSFSKEFETNWRCSRWIFSFQGRNSFHRTPFNMKTTLDSFFGTMFVSSRNLTMMLRTFVKLPTSSCCNLSIGRRAFPISRTCLSTTKLGFWELVSGPRGPVPYVQNLEWKFVQWIALGITRKVMRASSVQYCPRAETGQKILASWAEMKRESVACNSSTKTSLFQYKGYVL